MLENNTITLNESDKEVINAILDGGEFSTPEEAVHAGLSLLKERQKKIDTLRSAIQEGRDSGYLEDFSFEEFLNKMREERTALNA